MSLENVIVSNGDTIILPIPPDLKNEDVNVISKKLAAISPNNSILMKDNVLIHLDDFK